MKIKMYDEVPELRERIKTLEEENMKLYELLLQEREFSLEKYRKGLINGDFNEIPKVSKSTNL